jgi:hypothetical protein
MVSLSTTTTHVRPALIFTSFLFCFLKKSVSIRSTVTKIDGGADDRRKSFSPGSIASRRLERRRTETCSTEASLSRLFGLFSFHSFHAPHFISQKLWHDGTILVAPIRVLPGGFQISFKRRDLLWLADEDDHFRNPGTKIEGAGVRRLHA